MRARVSAPPAPPAPAPVCLAQREAEFVVRILGGNDHVGDVLCDFVGKRGCVCPARASCAAPCPRQGAGRG